jgi:hypothetical protein
VSTAVARKPGRRASERMAKRASCSMCVPSVPLSAY